MKRVSETGVRRKLVPGPRLRIGRRLSAAIRNQRGAVFIMTALSITGLVTIVGFAADFGYAFYINQRLARAADMAAITAVSEDLATAVGGYTNTSALGYAANLVYAENVKQLPITGATTNVQVNQNSDGSVTATATYSFSVKTFFSSIFGLRTIPVAGTITSTAKAIQYINYYILVDTSQSMGLATTQTDMINLYNRVASYNNGTQGETGCVFGCHVKSAGQTYTNEYLAHNITPTITLRIDSAVQAIQSIISTASSVASTTSNIQIGLYMIQANPNTGSFITTVSSPSSNYSNLQSLAATIDLGANNSNGRGDTDYVNEFSAFESILPANGSGSSAASPKNYVFIVTDGLTDTYGACNASSHCTGPLDSTKCTALRSKATVGVIYTTYLPIYNNPINPTGYEINYTNLVAPYASQIAPALQACATSSDYYFEATYGSDIVSSMQTLFNKTLPISARLTQ